MAAIGKEALSQQRGTLIKTNQNRRRKKHGKQEQKQKVAAIENDALSQQREKLIKTKS